MGEFSFRTREKAIERFGSETFDLLVIGGGITGVAVARDAASRGLKVALIDRQDFAYGTSSRSSKLIHGGLRYLENLEFGLVFEALAERALLLKTVPHMVRPLPFYFPVYQGDPHPAFVLGLGMWLYDLLALFRTPGAHQWLSAKKFLREFPLLNEKKFKGGFRYFDASMWDDVLAVQIARAASDLGAATANYVEALSPIREPQGESGAVRGFRVRDRLTGREVDLRAHVVVGCVGPWTDELGRLIDPQWKPWLNPSKGVHLVFDAKRFSVPGALVMSHPKDGRISFVIPRPDFGSGVVIVGTTDSPVGQDPARVGVEASDVNYLMEMLRSYFPKANLRSSDILSAYVGVRPLVKPEIGAGSGTGGADAPLQKVSREHHIGVGPGRTVFVAGGKYTTHRKMGTEIVDYALQIWKEDQRSGLLPAIPSSLGKSATESPVDPGATAAAVQMARQESQRRGLGVPEALFERYGAAALKVVESARKRGDGKSLSDPEGFPLLEAQLEYCIETEMTVRLEDFYLRRVPLFLARSDGGLPWASELAKILSRCVKGSESEALEEEQRLRRELDVRSSWKLQSTLLD
jgi:glycerol-3-phosphate dehydrogenase